MTAKRAYKQFHIGFSKEEWEIVCKKAKSARLRTGTYIRRMSVKGEIKYYELKELVTLKRAFLSIGNNLNQIAKVANESASDFYTVYENQMNSDYQVLLEQAKAEIEDIRLTEGRAKKEQKVKLNQNVWGCDSVRKTAR